MEYRRLGRTGIKVSVLSFGSWVTFDNQVDADARRGVHAGRPRRRVQLLRQRRGLRRRRERGDHGRGAAHSWAGRAGRTSSRTKLFWGIHDDVNMSNTLNRKYLMQAIDGSLERFGLDFVDVVYCHRADPDTPIEETVWAMSDIVSSGKALYWGTSEWTADEIREAIEIAERHHLHKPVTEQPQYNLLDRERVEQEYAELFDEFGYGTTIWSPLASGLAHRQVPRRHSRRLPRRRSPGYGWLAKRSTDPAALAKVEKLRPIADELGCTLAQLALAWCTKNPNVSTRDHRRQQASQVIENFAALDVIPRLTPEVIGRIDAAVAVASRGDSLQAVRRPTTSCRSRCSTTGCWYTSPTKTASGAARAASSSRRLRRWPSAWCGQRSSRSARTCARPKSATSCCSRPRIATRSRCRAATTSCCASATSTPSRDAERIEASDGPRTCEPRRPSRPGGDQVRRPAVSSPPIAQDADTGEVLMLAWMNAETLRRRSSEGRMVYWSRSRQALWRKGDTSGDRQSVREAYYDCDGDVLLFMVDQQGAAPATPARTPASSGGSASG